MHPTVPECRAAPTSDLSLLIVPKWSRASWPCLAAEYARGPRARGSLLSCLAVACFVAGPGSRSLRCAATEGEDQVERCAALQRVLFGGLVVGPGDRLSALLYSSAQLVCCRARGSFSSLHGQSNILFVCPRVISGELERLAYICLPP